MDKKLNQARWNFHYETARSNYFLECFGDSLAIKEGYPRTIYGFDAIYLYLAGKYGWTIAQCRSMSTEDIRLALATELEAWTAGMQFCRDGFCQTQSMALTVVLHPVVPE
ncbi:hypothetical protein EBM22_001893 [Escherichia coli]|uniref:hypothetical protein n=1 Tax=Escherichia coli TaxID=562 RepID=UPI00178CF925|nr:hypothetical protein [Escherichia coli]EIG6606804.1 hypothetical protein [Escherichia coli]